MASLTEKIALAFHKAKRINEAVWDGEGAGTVSIPRLRDIICGLYNVEVEMFEVDFPAVHLRGMIEVYNGGKLAKVFIRSNQDAKWKLFVTVKELCHVILDRKEDWSPHACDTLERLVIGGVLELEAPENNGVRSEEVAEFIAHELVYPHENRRKDLGRIADGEVTRAELSDLYGIPEEIIERVLNRAYLSACDYYWRLVTRGGAAE